MAAAGALRPRADDAAFDCTALNAAENPRTSTIRASSNDELSVVAVNFGRSAQIRLARHAAAARLPRPGSPRTQEAPAPLERSLESVRQPRNALIRPQRVPLAMVRQAHGRMPALRTPGPRTQELPSTTVFRRQENRGRTPRERSRANAGQSCGRDAASGTNQHPELVQLSDDEDIINTARRDAVADGTSRSSPPEVQLSSDEEDAIVSHVVPCAAPAVACFVPPRTSMCSTESDAATAIDADSGAEGECELVPATEPTETRRRSRSPIPQPLSLERLEQRGPRTLTINPGTAHARRTFRAAAFRAATPSVLSAPVEPPPSSSSSSSYATARPAQPRGSQHYISLGSMFDTAEDGDVFMNAPETERAHFFVEAFVEGLAPRVCSACHAFFAVGHLRLGFVASGVASTSPHHLRRFVASGVASTSPHWIHAHPQCLCRVNLVPRPSDRISISPRVVESMRQRLLQDLCRLSEQRLQNPAYPFPLPVEEWSYLPAALQNWIALEVGREPSRQPPVEDPITTHLNFLAARSRMLEDLTASLALGTPEFQPTLVMPNGILQVSFGSGGGGQSGAAVGRHRGHPQANGELHAMLHAVPVERLTEDCKSGPCAVCRDDMKQGEECRRLPCLHLFHKDCIDKWLEVKASCPLDNLQLREMLSMQENVGAESQAIEV